MTPIKFVLMATCGLSALSGNVLAQDTKGSSNAEMHSSESMKSKNSASSTELYNEPIASVVNQSLYGKNDKNIGEVDDIVLINGKPHIIVGVGGLVGIGEHEVALPLERLVRRGDRLHITDVTEEELRNMKAHDADAAKPLTKGGTIREGMKG